MASTPEAELDRVLRPGISHYEVLRIAPGRAADPVWLSKARKAVAMACHPDRWVHSTAELQERSQEAMARVNAAYTILSDPKVRSFYLKTTIAKDYRLCNKCGGTGQLKRQRGFNHVVFDNCPDCEASGYILKEKK